MDLTGAILLAGISVVIGLLLGMLVLTLRKDAAPEAPSREQALSDSEHNIRVWREGKESRLVVEINGVSHYRESDLHDEQKRIIADLTKELQAWLVTSPPPTPAVAVKIKPGESISEVVEEETQSTSLNPLKIFGRSVQPLEKTDSDESDMSIVTQIDEILQSKLAGTDREDQGIRLAEGPDQGMVIEVGLSSYTEIDAIPDEQVVDLIRLSVSEWEESLGD